MSVARRSTRTEGRQKALRLTLTDEEHAWLSARATRQSVTISRLVRRGVARDAVRDGETPPTTLCTADDYSEGQCAR